MGVVADAIEPAQLLECRASPFGGRLPQEQCGARGRVDLIAVMHLQDLDIPIGSEPRRRLLDKLTEEVDAERRIRRMDDCNLASSLLDLRAVLGLEPGGADEDGNPRGDGSV